MELVAFRKYTAEKGNNTRPLSCSSVSLYSGIRTVTNNGSLHACVCQLQMVDIVVLRKLCGNWYLFFDVGFSLLFMMSDYQTLRFNGSVFGRIPPRDPLTWFEFCHCVSQLLTTTSGVRRCITSATGEALLNKPRNKFKFRLESDMFVKCQMVFFKSLHYFYLALGLKRRPSWLLFWLRFFSLSLSLSLPLPLSLSLL